MAVVAPVPAAQEDVAADIIHKHLSDDLCSLSSCSGFFLQKMRDRGFTFLSFFRLFSFSRTFHYQDTAPFSNELAQLSADYASGSTG